MSPSRREAALNLALHSVQGLALETEATEVLFGGAAGGGKSHLMRTAAIIWAAAIAGLQVYLFRRTRPDLIKNHIEGPKGFRQLLAPWVEAGLVTIVEDEIRFWNGSRIYLCHCKDEKDRFKYQGAEIHVLLIDELTHFTDVIYRFLRGRVRIVGIQIPERFHGLFPRILCGSNPGNIGHQWVKATFIDRSAPLAKARAPKAEGGMLRQYIPARLGDNPSMEEDDPGYGDRLEGLGSPALVKAMKDGDWNVIAGAFFPEFSTARHVIRPLTLPKRWIRFRSFDWGSAKPFSCGWWAVSDGELPMFPRGALIRYRELYGMADGQPNVGLKLTAEEVARRIAALEKGEEIAYGVADPACFSEDGGPSIAERMLRAGCGKWRPADNKRVAGWDQVRARLKGDGVRPMLYLFDTSTGLIRTLPALQHDDDRLEDVDSDAEDHAPDEARYACMSRPYTAPPIGAGKPNPNTFAAIMKRRAAARRFSGVRA
jgi:hypothetical protein